MKIREAYVVFTDGHLVKHYIYAHAVGLPVDEANKWLDEACEDTRKTLDATYITTWSIKRKIPFTK